MDCVNEKTDYFVNVTFKDEDGNLVTPTKAYYNLYCETSETVILIETEIVSLDTTVEVIVTADQNKIQNPKNNIEEKVMTVRFTYSGGSRQGTAEHRWSVLNLRKIS